jgi:hypothetical protein
VSGGFDTDALLAACGVHHGFGRRNAAPPDGLVRPRQVHGSEVARIGPTGLAEPAEADAIVSCDPARAVAVVTADCVPILVCAGAGECVAAVHAGWRGLAAGVIAAAVEALRAAAPGAPLRAAIGPHIRACCYEVDEPVTARLGARFPEIGSALRPSRAGHHYLELGALVRAELVRSGVERQAIGARAAACTCCDPLRFHSYRRDGPAAGRLVHFVRPRAGAGRAA